MKIARAICIAATLATSVAADEAGYQRMRNARNAVMEIAANKAEFVGRRFEGLCPIASVDTDFMTCLVINRKGNIVGNLLVAMQRLPSKQSVKLLNECDRDISSDAEIKPGCIVYFRGRVDDNGVVLAFNTEIAHNTQ